MEFEDAPPWQLAAAWTFWIAAIVGSMVLAVAFGWSFSEWPMIAYVVIFVNLAIWTMTSSGFRRRNVRGRSDVRS